jgi:hypothetical protein
VSWSTTRACWAHTDAASGYSKIVRTRVAMAESSGRRNAS